jgi:hypothetical protein
MILVQINYVLYTRQKSKRVIFIFKKMSKDAERKPGCSCFEFNNKAMPITIVRKV